jgi:hypothetical protein
MLLPEENKHVLQWVTSLTSAELIFFLAEESLPTANSLGESLTPNPLNVAVGLASWLKANLGDAPRVLSAAAAKTPTSVHAAPLKAAAERLLLVKQTRDAAGPPHEARLARGVPIVNRQPLRSYLGNVGLNVNSPVFVVRGDPGLGRTHSWHLINYVADQSGAARVVKADMISPVLPDQTLDALFNYLVEELGLDPGPAPTKAGVTSDTLAARYAANLAQRIRKKAPTWAKPVWLVFDHTDRPVRPEIKRFVADLAQFRLNQDFDNCVLFILGPDPAVNILDPFAMVRSEPIGEFTSIEIREAAEKINQLGAEPLKEPALAAEIADMVKLHTKFTGRDFCGAVADALVQLRIKVKA